MELKVSFKDGDKSASFKFGGDPAEIIGTAVDKLCGLWSSLTEDRDDSAE